MSASNQSACASDGSLLSIPNLGHLFYVRYFKGIDDVKFLENSTQIKIDFKDSPSIEEKNNEIFNQKLCPSVLKANAQLLAPFPLDENNTFCLQTTNPGLLLGSGYSHEIGAESELKLGFFFDYTTGLPVIAGSSVKGVLRSAFQHPNLIMWLVKREFKMVISDQQVKIWENEIFENPDYSLPNAKRDIFYDAFIVGVDNDNSLFLGKDFITPHKNPLKNPIPIQFLKILPGITFCFVFSLQDGDCLSAIQKLVLFQKILCLIGIGAKTNVGYGHWKEIDHPNWFKSS